MTDRNELNPYRSPSEVPSQEDSDTTPMWQDRGQLVVRQNAKLPKRCVRCNVDTGGRLTCVLTWHTPVTYLLTLGGIFPYLAYRAVLQQTVEVRIGICN